MGRSNDDNDDDDSNFGKHPALRNFNRTGFMVKHVVKGVLKWGAIGAVAAVAGAAVMAMAGAWMGGILTAITAFAAVLFPEIQTIGAEFGIKMAMYSAATGGIVGAAVGGIVAISGASEAADAEEDRLVAKFEQQEARKERMIALERRRDEQRYAMERQSEAMRGPGAQMQLPRGKQGQGMGHAHA